MDPGLFVDVFSFLYYFAFLDGLEYSEIFELKHDIRTLLDIFFKLKT